MPQCSHAFPCSGYQPAQPGLYRHPIYAPSAHTQTSHAHDQNLFASSYKHNTACIVLMYCTMAASKACAQCGQVSGRKRKNWNQMYQNFALLQLDVEPIGMHPSLKTASPQLRHQCTLSFQILQSHAIPNPPAFVRDERIRQT